ncbi:autotransporter-associated beta strand repeat-containing protein [Tuwongella immobilis]|uniref:Autotransporter domain-containing protein n=1 Tax=Tuwongella immobilis TaxID=692036 RepID=A0A6C2YU36_9BACT|nr:autotransporter-associated beta strand repeat-containing protein [Tuwongella immobilis]VIP05150.1 Uncharacterized protein OS=Serratia fonticola RB-25 GN=Z042_13610 PE=4 SV=1: Autotrns_rpt: Autotrns_rpt: Autotrns_rpt: Autotrns_rpt: VCBS [Tuwongella immobilis]VTS07656.1 Uncharacterized protein OS=Serratia fonticola RB-25 GN=Z042_13610 PE=4 SV=1: Autotrns_rpt: Autotrns_rpt: Autotrns_rpt: Autotrns_rpt: VCBS [Tuwongella immobilis]
MPLPSWLRRLWTRSVSEPQQSPSPLRPGLDVLEDRVTPAYNLILGSGSGSTNVTTTVSAGVTTFEATGPGAQLGLFVVFNALQTGDVIITTGTGGSEAGNITSNILGAEMNATPASGSTISFRSGSGPNLVGNIELPQLTFSGGAVNLDVQAAGNVRFVGSFNSSTTPLATVTLSSTNGSISTDSGATVFGTPLAATAKSGINITTQVSSLEAKSATGGITIQNTGNLTVGGVSASLSGVDITTSGTVDIQANGTITVSTAGEDITTASGDIVLTADDLTINQAINAGTGKVSLRPFSAGRQIDLGSNAAGNLGITQAELTLITAGAVAIGRNDIATGTVVVSKAFGVTGTTSLSVTTARDIDIIGSGPLTSVDGDLSLSANQQATPTSGNFIGIDVFSASVTATGTGNVLLQGRGGDTDFANFGVRIVRDVSGASTTIIGTGGNSTGVANYGIDHQNGGTITSTGGDVTLIGTGGGTGASSSQNYGIRLGFGAIITAGGTGTVNATFRGGNSGSNASQNIGLYMLDSGTGALITSGGGAINITATGSSTSSAIQLTNNAAIRSGNNAPITITADSISLNDASQIDSGTGTTIIRPNSTGTRIDLGGSGTLNGSPLTLGLTDAELDRFTAGTLIIGRNDIATGGIQVSAAVSPANVTTLSLITPAEISGAGSIAVSKLAMRAVTGIALTGANAVSTLALQNKTSGTVAFHSTTNLLVSSVDGLTGANNKADLTISTSAGSDLTIEAGISGVASSQGKLTLDAGQDLLLGTDSNFGDVTSTVLTLKAGRDIVVSNQTYAQGGTGVTATAGRNITIQGDSLINSTGGSAPVSLTTGASGILTLNNSIADRGSATSVGGLLTVTADDIVLTGGALSSSGTVIIRPVSAGRQIDLGTNTTGQLGITQAELDRISASSIILGRNDIATGEVMVSKVVGLTGTTSLTVITARNIRTSNATSLTTVNGNLNLSANQQTTATPGDFTGIDVFNSTIGATGTGQVTIAGRSGNASTLQMGITVRAGAIITGGTTGTLTVSGISNGSNLNNYGLFLLNVGSSITSKGASVSVTGQGGSGSGDNNSGIAVQTGAQITAGGMGTVFVQGTGGTGTNSTDGILLLESNTKITSNGGNVTVIGIGGGSSTGIGNVGIRINQAQISAGGTGTLTVQGTAGNSTGESNFGINLLGTGGAISSAGTVSVTGTGRSHPSSFGISIRSNAIISSSSNANLSITTDSLGIDATGQIQTGTGTLTIRPRTAGTNINLGGADVLSGSPLTLGLTLAELSRITAATLQIGDATTGSITVSQAVNPANITSQVRVGEVGGGNVNLNANLSTSNNAALTIVPNVVVGGTPTILTDAGAITFSGTVNGDGSAGRSLTTTTTGATTFTGAVGATNPLAALTITTNTLTTSAIATTTGLTVTQSGAGTIGGAITNTGGLVKGGTGTLTLAAANSYSGNTQINAGTLRAGAANVFSANSAVSLADAAGATLDLNGLNQSIGSLAGGGITGGNVTLGAATLTVGGNSASTSYAGIISGSGSLVKQGTGTLTLTGTNTFTGTTTIDAGRLNVDGSIAGNLSVGGSGTLGGNGTIGGNVSGSGTVAPGASPGKLTINGDFTPSGIVEFEVNPPAATAGTDYDQIEVEGAVDLSAATFSFVGTAQPPTVAANQVVTLIRNLGGEPITESPAFAQGSIVTINGTTYRLFYQFDGNDDLILRQDTAPTTVYVSATFTQAVGSAITDADFGTARDQAAVAGVTAFTTIAAALAAIADGGTIIVNEGNYSEAVNLTATRVPLFRITGADAAQSVTLGSLATATGVTVQIDGTSVLSINGDNSSTLIAGVISGSGSLVKQGTGTLTLTGTNTFTGTTTIDAGRLNVDGSIAGNLSVGGSGTLGGNGTIGGNVSGSGTVAPGASPGKLTINGDFTPSGIVEFEVNPPATTAGTDYDQIEVEGAVDLSAATFSFVGTAQPPTVAANQVVTLIRNLGGEPITESPAFAQGSIVTINGTTYRLFYQFDGNDDLILRQDTAPTTVYVSATFTQAVGSAITDADFGTARDQAAVAGVTAFTTIAAALAAIADGGTIIVNEGNYSEAVNLTATRVPLFRITGADAAQSVTLGSLATATGVTVQIDGTSVLSINGDNSSTQIAGVISGSGSLVKQGTGTLTLTGTNTFTGTTTINAGTLLVNGVHSGTGAVTVNATGTLGGTGSIAGEVTVNSGGQITGGMLGEVGTLTVGGLLFNGGTFAADFGMDSSDTIATAGTVNLASPGQAVFVKNSQKGTATPGIVFTLIDLTGSGTISNPPLANAIAGSSDTINGQSGVFGYNGGAGENDFVFATSGTQGVVITPTGGDTVVIENGATDTVQVRLTSRPVTDVTITLTPTSVNADPVVLVFTSANWNVPQTVTISVPDNTIVDGTRQGSVSFAVTSSDANYNGLTISPLAVTILDNDAAASVEVVGGSGQSAMLGSGFASPLSVVVRNADGQAVSGATVTFVVPTSGATAVLSTMSVITGRDGIATVTATAGLVAGTYLVTASSGEATPAELSLTNAVLSQSIDFPVPAPVPFAAGRTVALTATASSGLPVVYTVVSGPGVLNGSTLTATRPGTVIVQASQPGNAEFGAAESITIEVVFRPVGQDQFTEFLVSTATGVSTVAEPGQTPVPVAGPGPGSRGVVADMTGDGIADSIIASGPGARVTITVYDGATGQVVRTLSAFEDSFFDSATLAAADVNGDGIADLAVGADAFGGPRVTIFDGATGTVLADFFAIDDVNFRGGVRVALGDVDGDGFADLMVAAGVGGGPRVALWDGASLRPGESPRRLVSDFFAFEPTLRDGANVSLGDLNGDGQLDLILSGGPGGGPRVLVLDAAEFLASGGESRVVLANFFAAEPTLTGGAVVTAKDLDGDEFADLVVGIPTGPSTALVRMFLGNTITSSDTPPVFEELTLDVSAIYVG